MAIGEISAVRWAIAISNADEWQLTRIIEEASLKLDTLKNLETVTENEMAIGNRRFILPIPRILASQRFSGYRFQVSCSLASAKIGILSAPSRCETR